MLITVLFWIASICLIIFTVIYFINKGEEEYIISNTQRVITHANIDDSVIHWTLNLRDGGKGNLKR